MVHIFAIEHPAPGPCFELSEVSQGSGKLSRVLARMTVNALYSSTILGEEKQERTSVKFSVYLICYSRVF